MGKPTTNSPSGSAADSIQPRQIFYAVTSFSLGAWAFYKVNAISGPAFEPILAVCSDSSISADDFAQKTGYHSYEPMLGLGAFKVLVCLITQFLLELRETYPAGLLTWGGVVVVALPLTLSNTIIAGRKGTKGPVIYPTVIGLLSQLFGVSVIFPLIYNPSFIFSGSKLGYPITNLRTVAGLVMALPITILTYLVFTAPTESYVWTVSAGTLGGPILAMVALTLWTDKSSSMEATPQNIIKSSRAVQKAFSLLAIVGFGFWACLVAVAFRSYGLGIGKLWNDIWVEAGPSVKFMTIDTGVLYISSLLFIAYQSEWKAIRAFLLTPLVGPATAFSLVFMELESKAANALLVGQKKDN